MLTPRQAQWLTPNEGLRIERLEAAKLYVEAMKFRPAGKWNRIHSLIGKLEQRALDRELARMIEAETPALTFTRPLIKKTELFKRYAKKPFCG
jgi:hypothetical protein